jgi:hypothetical protein
MPGTLCAIALQLVGYKIRPNMGLCKKGCCDKIETLCQTIAVFLWSIFHALIIIQPKTALGTVFNKVYIREKSCAATGHQQQKPPG